MSATVIHGRCENILPTLPDCSVDAVVTDPPYELGFMGKGWDSTGIAYSVPMWAEVLRVLKPGGHLLSFGGTRTWHRMAVAIEDAGFEIRDSIAWMYGSGFPKSLDVSKAIDKAAGAEREVVGVNPRYVGMSDRAKRALGRVVHEETGGSGFSGDPSQITAPATPDAARWQGWGTALKPAFEPVAVARKPLVGTVASNVLTWGTGALNVDGCRVDGQPRTTHADGNHRTKPETDIYGKGFGVHAAQSPPAGRWPANVILDEFAADLLDAQSGGVKSAGNYPTGYSNAGGYGGTVGLNVQGPLYADTGGASRFFYVAKAPKSERPNVNGIAHATVKPLTLIRYLVRLITPPGGTVLDPFAGSGTTGEACIIEGFNSILIEREADHIPLIHHRIDRATDALGLFGEETA